MKIHTLSSLCCLFVSVLFLTTLDAMAVAPEETIVQPSERPRIGLALSGGGARGVAHVGVLKLLEEMHIPIDYIAGTSMGSIIGGLYASGMSPDEIEHAVKDMDWEHIFSDSPPRKQRSFRRKRDDDLYLVKIKLGISDSGDLKFPTGAIQGQKFDLALTELTLPVADISDFDQLHIPFRAVASDIGSGKAVVLGSGQLSTALRASMAVPGVFAATEINGALMVDGGITDNLPIDVVRDMGADIVIAVDIGSPSLKAEEVNNLFKITQQLTSIMTRTNVEAQIATLTERDVLIVPNLRKIKSTDFTNATDAIPYGREGAEEHRDELQKLSLTDSEYQAHLRARITRPANVAPQIDFIKVANTSTVSNDLIRDRIYQKIGTPLDVVQLEHDISTIYGLELFETVGYEIVEEDSKKGLFISAKARSWGPNYLQFGMALDSDERGNNSYNLGVSYLRTEINSLNGEIRLAGQIGADPRLAGEWYQPLGTLSQYFMATGASFGASNVSLFNGKGQDRLAEFRVDQYRANVAFGREISTYGEARIGYRYRSGKVELSSGTPGWPEFDYDTAQLFGRLAVDRLDNYNFPANGWAASLEYDVARENYGGDSDFEQMRIRANKFSTFGEGHVLGFAGKTAITTAGKAAIQDRFRLGGFLNLSGFAEDALSGQNTGIMSLIYYKQFAPDKFFSGYLGGSLEYGGVWEERKDIFEDGIASGSIFFGADTPFGPVYIGYGLAEGYQHSLFFYLGRPQFQ